MNLRMGDAHPKLVGGTHRHRHVNRVLKKAGGKKKKKSRAATP